MKIHYCKKCDKWRGTNKECPECKNETIEREAPSRRNSFYYIPGIDIPLVSVTTILKALAKPQLTYWAAKTAASKALENPNLSVEEAVSSIYKTRDKAGAKGIDIHKMIDKEEYGEVEKLPDIVRGYIRAYEKWKASMPHKTLFKEQVIFSKEHSYAGTLDRIIKIIDKIWIIDFKTSKGIYADTGLQLSAYRNAAIEMELVDKIDGIAGVHLKPNGTFDFIEFDENFEVFLALKKVYGWDNKRS